MKMSLFLIALRYLVVSVSADIISIVNPTHIPINSVKMSTWNAIATKTGYANVSHEFSMGYY